MKLKALLSGIMIACCFVACSNEEDGLGPRKDDPSFDATAALSIQISNPKTKAIGNAEVLDTKISSLSVLVFDGTGDDAKLEKLKTVNAGNGDLNEVTEIPVKAGNKQVVVFANVPEDQLKVATYASLKDETLTFSEAEVNGTLSMNSKTYQVTITADKDNYLGYAKNLIPDGGVLVITSTDDAATPVRLYRNVGKVVLNEVKMVLTEDQAARHPGASFTLKEVFLLHGPENTTLMGAGGKEWGATSSDGNWLNGATNDAYAKWVARVNESTDKQIFHAYLTKGYKAWTSGSNTFHETISDVKITNGEKAASFGNSFYAYENASVATEATSVLLVLKGDFTYETQDVDGNEKPIYTTQADRYYTIAVGLTGLPDGYSVDGFERDGQTTFRGFLRNLTYNVNFELKGPGYDTPFSKDETMVKPTITVVKMGFMGQHVDIGGE